MKETKKEITELLIYEYNPLHLIIFYSLGLSFTKNVFFFYFEILRRKLYLFPFVLQPIPIFI